MKKTVSALLTAVLTVGTALLTSCGTASSASSQAPASSAASQTEVSSAASATGPKVLNWVADGEVTTMDAGKSYDVISGSQIDFQVDTLYSINEKNEAVPSLATALPQVSKDGLTVTVDIRDDARYSNGDKITAADVVYAAQRVVDPKTGSQNASQLNYLKNAEQIIAGKLKPEELGIKALSDTKLQFSLVAPSSYINTTLSSGLLSPISKKFVEAQGKNYGLSADSLLSSGPYVLKDWNGTDISWKFVKNPYYWDAKNIYFDQINVQVVKEVATGVNLYEAGKLDGTKVTGDYLTLYKGKPDLKTVQTLRLTNLEMGISSNKDLQNENLRKALFYAVDRQELVSSILNGEGVPAVGVIPDGIAVNPDNGKSVKEDFDPLVKTDDAKAAGYFQKALSELGKKSVSLKLITSDEDQSIKIGQYLQSVYEKKLPGLKIELSNVPATVRFKQMMSYKFDLALGGWTGDFDPTSYIQQHETSYEHNHSQWKSQELTDLLKKLNTTDGSDFTLRWQHLKEGNNYLLDHVVVIPLYQGAQSFLVNPKLKGIVTHVLGTPIDITHAYFE